MRKIFLPFLILFCACLSFAQGPADICTNATPALLTSGTGYVINGNNSAFTDNGEGVPVGWQAFTTPSGTCNYNVTISYCGTVPDVSVYNFLAEGNCSEDGYTASVFNYCSDLEHYELTYDGLQPNTTYYYAVGGPDAGYDVGNYVMTITANQVCAPSNDDCSNTTPATVDGSATVTVTGTSTGATASADEGIPVVWESFTLPASSTSCTYDIDLSFCGSETIPTAYFTTLYTDCSLTTTIDGEDLTATTSCMDGAPEISFTDLQPGTYYYPILGDYNDGTYVNMAGDYTINYTATPNCTPANDLCSNVIPILLPTGSTTLTGTTVGATINGNETAPLVWEAFTTPNSACTYSLDISYCNMPTDLYYYEYLQPSCDNDGVFLYSGFTPCSVGNDGTVLYESLDPNTTYYLPILGDYVDGDGNVNPAGPYSIDLTLTETCPPPNDLCSDVTPVSLQNGVAQSFSGTTSGAQTNGNEYVPMVWEAFTVPGSAGCNYDVEISYCGSASTTTYVSGFIYTSCDMTDSAEGTFSNCSDGYGILDFTNIAPGTYYYPVYGSVVYGNAPDYTVNPVGDYSFTVTATAPTVTTPTIAASGPTTFCNGGSVVLSSGSSDNNVWSNGATTQSITVSASGSYTVYTTNGGCQSAPSDPVTVIVNGTTAPSVTASGPTTLCGGGNVTLTSSANTGNTWSNGATTQSITVSDAGSYSVTATTDGCTSPASDPVIVTVVTMPATPTVTASGATAFCSGGSVTLTSSAANGNIWSNGATTQSISVTTGGSYSVAASNGSCTSASSTPVTVTVNAVPATPVITASGSTTFCDGGSVVLTSSAATGNTWSNGATSPSITVTGSGTYSVYTTNASECQSLSSDAVTVTENPIPATPTVTASGATTFCSGGSVTLTSSAASGNNWSNGATTPSADINASGSYSVTVTANGCTSSSSTPVTVTVNSLPSAPTISASGATTFCEGGDVSLTSSAATGNTWSNGSTTSSVTINASGSYTVTTTDGNNCTSPASDAVAVTVNPIPATPVITPSGPLTICAGTDVTLASDANDGNVWSNGATSQNIVINEAGDYNVTVTQNGCSSGVSNTVSVSVSETPDAPVITPMGSITVCEGVTTILSSSYADGNTWSTGATTQTVDVGAGTYTVTYSNDDGCSSAVSDAVVVTETPSATVDGISITNSGNGNVTATATNPQNAETYTWNFGDGTGDIAGANPQPHQYQQNGDYTVTLTVSNNCGDDSSQATASITNTTAVNNLNIDGHLLLLYPNPAQSQLTVENKSVYKIQTLIIYDMTGREVYRESGNGATICHLKVGHLLSGSYMLKVETDKGATVRKFDIIH